MKPPGRRPARDFPEVERLLWQLCDWAGKRHGELERRHGAVVRLTGAGAGTPVSVRHTLGRVPTGFEVAWKDGTGDLWVATGDEWNDTLVTFRGTAAVAFTVRVYVLEE